MSKTIQIYLPGGDPRGLRIAELTTHIVQAVQVPRSLLDQFFQRPESRQVGVYVLFGSEESSAKPLAYIGQTEDFHERFAKHDSDRRFWQQAVALVSSKNNFTQTHLRYLEWLAIKEARTAGRYQLENGNGGSKPHTPEALEADILDSFETIRVLLSVLGFPLFEPVAGPAESPSISPQRMYWCRGADGAEGRGYYQPDGFAVLKGSLFRKTEVKSLHEGSRLVRRRLLENGVLADAGKIYELREDFLFLSPSAAACAVLGRPANGWNEWKDEQGITLDNGERKKIGR